MIERVLRKSTVAQRTGIAALVCCVALLSLGAASFAQTSKGSGCDSDLMKNIYKVYFDQNEPAKGIEQLSQAIEGKKVRFSQKDLKNCVLPILGDYYKTKYDDSFKSLIKALLDQGNADVIKAFFAGSSLKSNVDAAVKEWGAPSQIVIITGDQVAVGDSMEVKLGIANASGAKLRPTDVIKKAEVGPAERGAFKLGERSWFYGKEKGKAQLTLFAENAQGQPITASKQIVVVASMGPSMKWPLVSTGAFVASAVAFIYFNGQASDKSDECNGLEGDAWDKCDDDYKSLHRWEVVSGGAALVAAGVSGYLWYRYFSAKKAGEKTAYVPGNERMRLEPYANGFALSYRF
jgi:hypothetical protein